MGKDLQKQKFCINFKLASELFYLYCAVYGIYRYFQQYTACGSCYILHTVSEVLRLEARLQR